MASSVGMAEKVDFSDLLQEAEQMVADLEPEAAGAIAGTSVQSSPFKHF